MQVLQTGRSKSLPPMDKHRFNIRFLGTGTSTGVPMIGCDCPVCTSEDPRDWRDRTSIYLTLADKGILIDTGPEMRIQCVKWRVPRVDAICITHLHADHIFGFDDIRRFNTMQGAQPIPCFASPETIDGLQRIFPYIGANPNAEGLYRPQIIFTPVTSSFETCGARITPLPVIHGKVETYGFRVDFEGRAMAYLPDVHDIPKETLVQMQGLDCLILNLLRQRYHPTHLTLERATAFAQIIRAKQTYYTHFSHDFTHAQLLERIQSPAYDGLTIDL